MLLPNPAAGDDKRIAWEADGIGHYSASATSNCPRALYLHRIGEEPTPPPAGMAQRYRDGHMHEVEVLDRLRHTGVNLTHTVLDDPSDPSNQLEVTWEAVPGRVRVIGHPDGIWHDFDVRAILNWLGRDSLREGDPVSHPWVSLDVKSLSSSMWDVLRRHGLAGFPYYLWQFTSYIEATEMPVVAIFKSKDSGETLWGYYPTPLVDPNKIRMKLLQIEMAARARNMPDCPSRKDFPCPFYLWHDEENLDSEGEDAPPELVAAVTEAARRLTAARAAESQAKTDQEEAKDELTRLMGDRTDLSTTAGTVTLQNGRGPKRFLWDKAKAAGLNVDEYTAAGKPWTTWRVS